MRCSYSVDVIKSLYELERFSDVPFRIIHIEKVEVIENCPFGTYCPPTVKYLIVKEICWEGEK